MSTTSIKPVPTLKGIFSVPKTNHRRDFLRENKLNLRELQRVTTNKLKANQPQDQFKHNKQQQTTQQQQQQQQNLANRRSASQARIPAQKPPARSLSQQRPPPAEPRQNRQPSRCSSVCSVNNRVGDGVRRGSNTTVVSKAISCDKQIQTEDINDEEFLYRALKRCTGGESNGHSSTKLNSNVANQRQSHSDLHMPHHSSYIANGEDCHDDCFQPAEQQEQQQQTEHYQHVNYQQQQQPNYQQQQQSNYPQQYPNYQQQSNYNHQQQSNYNQQQYEKPHENYQQLELDCEVQQDTQRTRNSYNPNNNNNNNNNNHNNNNIIMDNEEAFHNSARITTRPSQRSHHSQHSIRSQNSHQSQQSHHSIRSHHSINSQHSQRSQQLMNGQHQVKANVEDMELNLDNLAIDGQQPGDQLHQAQQSNQQLPLSGHSRVTVASTHSQELTKKKSNGSVHKLGSRDDVRLPRYLEREKREKEEQRLREIVRDPNCPFGHFALTEDERLAALATAQKKFQTLINELNHMPMTTQTLRIRTRKGEIEKELATLEADIRIFSKSKVYIKKPEEPVE